MHSFEIVWYSSFIGLTVNDSPEPPRYLRPIARVVPRLPVIVC